MIVTFKDLANVRKANQDKKIILTSGTFDLFHVGNLSNLEQVKAYGDIMLVLLMVEKKKKKRKGPNRPIFSESDRARILDSLKVVDYVMIDHSGKDAFANQASYSEILAKLQPDYYVTDGHDPRFVTLLDKSKFIIAERTRINTSTTDIINHIHTLEL